MTPKEFITNIQTLIAKDELNTALQQLNTFLKGSPKLDEVIQQSARFQNIRKQIRLGTISHADANLTKNQISVALIDLLREMEEQSEQHEMQEEMKQAISIVNSKNVVIGSTFNTSGNIIIGDSNTYQNADKVYNIDKIDNANFS